MNWKYKVLHIIHNLKWTGKRKKSFIFTIFIQTSCLWSSDRILLIYFINYQKISTEGMFFFQCWVSATYGSAPSTTNTSIEVPVSPFLQIHDPTIFVYTNASVGEMLWNISRELNISLSLWSIEVKGECAHIS